MLVEDFIEKNKDLLVSPITEEEFHSLTDGAVFFCISAAPGSKPIEKRTVKTAGYHMVASTVRPKGCRTDLINALALTAGGYAKVAYITPEDVYKAGNKLLYHCRPMPVDDIRCRHNNGL